MIAHSISIEVFVFEGEDIDQIRNKLRELFPFDLEEEEISITQKSAIGFNKQRIKILSIDLEKRSHIRDFLTEIMKNLDLDTKNKILFQAEKRLDENLNFFLRFNKYELLENNRYTLTEKGDCFFLRMKIAAFPKSKSNALDVINQVFQ